MKKLTSFCLLCISLFLFVPAATCRAQAVSAWFRGTAQSWQTLTQTAFSAPKVMLSPLSRPLSGLSTGYTVKTTVPNWLNHRLSHSNTFCRMEKELFKIHPNNPSAVTGKLSYLLDRNTLLAESAAPGEINQKAFLRHQDLLQNTLAEVENYWEAALGERYHSTVFSKKEIANLLADPKQPPAFILSTNEINQFPLMTLQQQQAFTRRAAEDNTNALTELLSQNPEELSTSQFSHYYYLKLRQKYFTLLLRVMDAAQAPRQTLIIRVRKQIQLDFLPGKEAALTDAQRLGKLYFYKDHAKNHSSDGINEQLVALKSEIARQEKIYAPYAQAEAFNIPYELVLTHPQTVHTYALGAAEAERLKTLTNRQITEEVPVLIQQTQAYKNALLSAKNTGTDFFIHYYRLCVKEQILQTYLARSKFFLEHGL